MIRRFKALFRPRLIAEELRRESRALLLERLRVGLALALILIPVFIPLDFLRMPDRFAGVLLVRLAGCAFLLALFPLTGLKAAEPWAEWIAVLGVTAVSATVLGVGRFSQGA